MAELKAFRGNYYLWKYLPSVGAAATFMILFLLVTAAHCWRLHRTRKWFGIPFIIGGFMELVGYATRIAAYDKTDHLMPYAIQSSYILLAPVFFAATIYMTLGRVILSIPDGRDLSPINPRWIPKIFVMGDVLTLCVQAGASGLMFNQITVDVGNGVIIGGIVLQILSFASFGGLTVWFHSRLRHRESRDVIIESRAEQCLITLYIVSALILFRSIFRLVEFVGGRDGYLLSTEWPLYIFDTLPMFVVMVVFGLRYPDWIPHSISKIVEPEGAELQESVREGAKIPKTKVTAA